MTGFAPRNRMERALVAIGAGSLHPSGYTLAPMPPEAIERVALLFRRSRALRRRSPHTKAGRRARRVTYFRRAGEVCR